MTGPEPGDDPRFDWWGERATEPTPDHRQRPGPARAEDYRPGPARAEQAHPVQEPPTEPAEPTERGDVSGDLWSAPMSALPIDEGGLFAAYNDGPAADDTLPPRAEGGAEGGGEDGMRPGSSPSAPDPDSGSPDSGSPRTGERGTRRSGALALAIAVVILITLGLAAQWLAPSAGPDGGASGNREPVTGNGEPSTPPAATQPLSPATLERTRRPLVVTSGSRDCPMRLAQDRQEPAASPGERYRCFFIQ